MRPHGTWSLDSLSPTLDYTRNVRPPQRHRSSSGGVSTIAFASIFAKHHWRRRGSVILDQACLLSSTPQLASRVPAFP
jgi:hypothetical protein